MRRAPAALNMLATSFAVIGDDWQPGGDELTPTMKLRRKPIAAKYAAVIDALYSERRGEDTLAQAGGSRLGQVGAEGHGDLGVGQPALVRELAVSTRRMPGRHLARLRHLRDRFRALEHVFVADERERRGLAGTMAGHAVRVEDRGHVFAERDGAAARLDRAGL